MGNIEKRLTEDDEENLSMEDLPAYDTPKMPDQEEGEYEGETVTLYDPWRLDDDAVRYKKEGKGRPEISNSMYRSPNQVISKLMEIVEM